MTWNSLPDNLRHPTLGDVKFGAGRKTQFLFKYQNMERIRGVLRNCAL